MTRIYLGHRTSTNTPPPRHHVSASLTTPQAAIDLPWLELGSRSVELPLHPGVAIGDPRLVEQLRGPDCSDFRRRETSGSGRVRRSESSVLHSGDDSDDELLKKHQSVDDKACCVFAGPVL